VCVSNILSHFPSGKSAISLSPSDGLLGLWNDSIYETGSLFGRNSAMILPQRRRISRTKCPLAIPPIAGLQDHLSVRSMFQVSMPYAHPNVLPLTQLRSRLPPAITITSRPHQKTIASSVLDISAKIPARISSVVVSPFLTQEWETLGRPTTRSLR